MTHPLSPGTQGRQSHSASQRRAQGYGSKRDRRLRPGGHSSLPAVHPSPASVEPQGPEPWVWTSQFLWLLFGANISTDPTAARPQQPLRPEWGHFQREPSPLLIRRPRNPGKRAGTWKILRGRPHTTRSTPAHTRQPPAQGEARTGRGPHRKMPKVRRTVQTAGRLREPHNSSLSVRQAVYVF